MPFSTYLRDPAPRDDRTAHNDAQQQQQQQHPHPSQILHPQQSHFEPQEHYPGYGVYSPADVMKHYGNYYARSAPSNSAHTAHSSAGPSSSGSTSSSSSSNSNSSGNGNGKRYPPPSPSARGAGGNNGLFQMPSFLMGGFGGTLAPGGGAEVLTPSTMGIGMFDFVPTPYVSAHAHDSRKPWQTTKYYTLEEHGQRDDVATVASSSSSTLAHHAHSPGPVASPFGYLNAESPQEHVANEQEEKSMDEAAVTTIASPDDPSAMAETDALRPPELYAPVPSAGLPVYSQSGFDMLGILARVATRPNKAIFLGPVDLTCAFVVSDVRRVDAPIVYASPTFCELTGYAEGEVVGRNCRFLQAPGGRVSRSDVRRFTSPDAVRELRFALDKDREVQVSLINYRKDGLPFVNRVSIVPIPAEDGTSEIAFHVGFQVDLNEQPGLIARRMQDGKFYSASALGYPSYKALTPAERSARGIGKKLRSLLSDPSFQSSTPLTTSCNATSSTVVSSNSNPNSNSSASMSAPKPSSLGKPDARDERQWLNLLLLEHMPDFVHVLSLKGHFLYVSPGVTRVLGYTPVDLVGKSVGDFCHPSDAVPLLRELKESTGQTAVPSENGNTPSDAHEAQTHMGQRTVDLLFRMRSKTGGYVWIESIGRLHVESGKGRKAVVLSGRMCVIPNLRWGAISQAGGLLGPTATPNASFTDGSESEESGKNNKSTEREFWAILCDDGLFLVAGMGARDLLGWGTGEMIGRSIRDFIINGEVGGNYASTEQVLTALGRAYGGERDTQSLSCRMRKRDGETVWMQLMLYANIPPTMSGRVIVQFKLLPPPTTSSSPSAFQTYSPAAYQNASYAFSFSPSQASPSYPLLDKPAASVTTARAGRILHAPTTNVFAEFETHRGTSWQYELQQLKYANDKLREEVDVLEARQRLQQRAPWVGDVQV